MEKSKASYRQERRKKVHLSMSNSAGGGIEVVVVLGGALAIASLVAAFTIKKGNRKDSSKDTTNLAASDSCRKEDEKEGLRFILHDSSSTLLQNSCCTNHGTSEIGITQIEICEIQSLIFSEENIMLCENNDSVSGHREILIHDTEQESIAITGDIEEISRPGSEHKPMNVVDNESNDSSVVANTVEIEIEDEAVDADAEQPTEEMSTVPQSSLASVSPTEEDKSSSSTGEEDGEENALMQSSFSESESEEEEYSPMRSSFSTEEEDEEEEEFSPIQSSFSTEEDEEEEDSSTESSFEEEEEEEEELLLQSSSSTEEDENGEFVAEMEEAYAEGTWSSSTESDMEAIWPAEMMGVLTPESKEINISYQISVKKFEKKDTTANEEQESDHSNDGKNKKETQQLVAMNDQKEHSENQMFWVWVGLVLLLLLLLVNCLLQQNYLV